jgi:hypothetical protein
MQTLAVVTWPGRKFMPGEPMKCPTKVWLGRSNKSAAEPTLHGTAAGHHHHLVGKGQSLHLVVGHIDQVSLSSW